jgi:hypothetical protein
MTEFLAEIGAFALALPMAEDAPAKVHLQVMERHTFARSWPWKTKRGKN